MSHYESMLLDTPWANSTLGVSTANFKDISKYKTPQPTVAPKIPQKKKKYNWQSVLKLRRPHYVTENSIKACSTHCQYSGFCDNVRCETGPSLCTSTSGFKCRRLTARVSRPAIYKQLYCPLPTTLPTTAAIYLSHTVPRPLPRPRLPSPRT